MSLRLLTPCGIVGKLPSAGDFLRLNVAATVAGVLDDWCNAELAALDEREPDWRETFPSAPPWRFTANSGVAGAQPLAGVIRPSLDSPGRLFPCLAVAVLSDLSAEAAASSTPWFDAVEDGLTAAATARITAETLASELATRGGPSEDDIDLMTVRARSTPDGLFMDVQGGPDGRATTLQAVLETSPLPAGASLWWRHDTGRTKLLITPGLPSGAAFAALFHAPDAPVETAPLETAEVLA